MARSVLSRLLKAQQDTPALDIEGVCYPLATLQAMPATERGRWGAWAGDYISRFIAAADTDCEYPVITLPTGTPPVKVEPFIPGKTIVLIRYYSEVYDG